MTLPRTLGRMTTCVDRVFRPIGNGLFQEVYMHFIKFVNEDGTTKNMKLSKEEFRGIWREPKGNEHSREGETTFAFPGDSAPRRLICIQRG
ncbi:MAG: hypothetical protein E6R04_01035 [Spirochaetes bacterium]|nr:MAG: hypothetical protein E6R04_01035 [Spirochaetota bacterium]